METDWLHTRDRIALPWNLPTPPNTHAVACQPALVGPGPGPLAPHSRNRAAAATRNSTASQTHRSASLHRNTSAQQDPQPRVSNPQAGVSNPKPRVSNPNLNSGRQSRAEDEHDATRRQRDCWAPKPPNKTGRLILKTDSGCQSTTLDLFDQYDH